MLQVSASREIHLRSTGAIHARDIHGFRPPCPIATASTPLAELPPNPRKRIMRRTVMD
jgi:hypothetical protein